MEPFKIPVAMEPSRESKISGDNVRQVIAGERRGERNFAKLALRAARSISRHEVAKLPRSL